MFSLDKYKYKSVDIYKIRPNKNKKKLNKGSKGSK